MLPHFSPQFAQPAALTPVQPTDAPEGLLPGEKEPADDGVVDSGPLPDWFALEEQQEEDLEAEPEVGPTESIPLQVPLSEEASDNDTLELELARDAWTLKDLESESQTDEGVEPSPSNWLESPFKEDAPSDEEDRGEDAGAELRGLALELPPLDADADEPIDSIGPTSRASSTLTFDPCFREVYRDDEPSVGVLFLGACSLLAGNGLRWVNSDLGVAEIPESRELCRSVFDLAQRDEHTAVISSYAGGLFLLDLRTDQLQAAYAASGPSFTGGVQLGRTRTELIAVTRDAACWRLDQGSAVPTLVDETLLTLGRGVPACFLLLRDNNAVLTGAPELSSRLLLSPAPKFVGQDALQLTVDQSALALLVRETGLWGSDSPLLPAKPFPGFERAQAACAAQLAGRSVAWIADAGENGETDVIELDLADGRASIVAKVAFRETDEADPTVARIAWDAARNLLWLCSDAGTRVLRRLSA